MWNDEKQHRFDALRLKKAQGVLSDAEAQELQAFLAELQAEEAETLKKGMAKLDARLDFWRTEKEHAEAKNERLAAIIAEVVHEVTTVRRRHLPMTCLCRRQTGPLLFAVRSEQEQLLADAREYSTSLRGKPAVLRAKYRER